MRAIFSGIVYDTFPFFGLRIRSAIGRIYEIGEEPKIEAFEALPLPGVAIEEARVYSMKLYSGEPAVIVTPASYDFRRPLVEQATFVILDGRRVNRQESSRLKRLPEYFRRKVTGILGAPEKFVIPLLLAGADFVIDSHGEFHTLTVSSHEKLRKAFVEIVEDDPIALRFLRLLPREMNFHGEIIKGSLTALERPEVSRRVEKMRSYEPPEGDVLILLPCSAKKPYSLSKTHRPIIDASKEYRVHHLIITSPLIVVPRELETVFPAVSYDHPPTGKRTPGEKGLMKELLDILLPRYLESYKAVVVFLPEDYRDALEYVELPGEAVVFEGKRLDYARLSQTLRDLESKGLLRRGKRDRKGMARNALRFLYAIDPPEGLERFVDRIAFNGKTFGIRKGGVLKPKQAMLERLYSEGIYVRAPSVYLEDVEEVSGDVLAGLYVARERKGLRSLRLALSTRMIRKLLDAGVKGIYAVERV